MRFKKITAGIIAAAVALTLTGCGSNTEISSAPNPQQSSAGEKPTGSTSAQSQPEENTPAVQLPDIPVNDASAFEYKYDSELGGMVITDYKLQSPKIHIPDMLENEKVVKVDLWEVNKDITYIIMPDSVKNFVLPDKSRGSLQFVNIPASVTKLEPHYINIHLTQGCFRDCTNLTSIIIPDSLIEISDLAFCNCRSLTSVTIPNSVTEIGSSAFRDCTSLTSVTISNSVTKIGSSAFRDCTSLSSVTIPDSVTEIGYGVFDGCTSLSSVTIPDSVTKIDDTAFFDSKNIQATYKGQTYDYKNIHGLYNAINSN